MFAIRYARNRIYISSEEQEKIKKFKIFVAGSGIGSVIAEYALRLGFENIVIADGDEVEISNLNRQNYTEHDLGVGKAESIRKRLLSINSKASISIFDSYLTSNNIWPLLDGCDVAINALDFGSNVPFVFDELCQANNIPVLHPYNIGWASYIFIVLPGRPALTDLTEDPKGFEIAAVNHLLNNLDPSSSDRKWIGKLLNDYLKESGRLSPPQLSVGCWLLAPNCTNLIYRLATNAPISPFTDFYFLTTGSPAKEYCS